MPEFILNAENFDSEVLKSSVPVLVDFWAPWCGPCQMMMPIVESLARSSDPAKIKIAKLNVDDNSELSGKYQVLSIPTFIIFKNGQAADKLVGGVSEARLKEFLGKHAA